MANSSTHDEEHEEESLSAIFNRGLDLYNKINNNEAPTNSPETQRDVKEAMRTLEQATKLVSFTGVFSRNEGIEEVATTDLQYFLLPAILGSLSLKLTTGERKEIIEVAEVYFKDFLTRCTDYGLANYQSNPARTEDPPRQPQSEFEQIQIAVNTRANKIQRFREEKELRAKLKDLKKNMENEHADEDIKRDYFITMIKAFIHEAIQELQSIDMEKPILEHISQLQKSDKPEPKHPPPPPLKPIIITKDEMQKAVYGAGYPSLPSMTVQEFYDKRVRDGVFPDPNKRKPPGASMSLQEAALAGVETNNEDAEDEAKEDVLDADDPEYLARMRNMDEYKDEHRRGWGNRMNRS